MRCKCLYACQCNISLLTAQEVVARVSSPSAPSAKSGSCYNLYADLYACCFFNLLNAVRTALLFFVFAMAALYLSKSVKADFFRRDSSFLPHEDSPNFFSTSAPTQSSCHDLRIINWSSISENSIWLPSCKKFPPPPTLSDLITTSETVQLMMPFLQVEPN